jgi:hypothetical protein
MKGWMRNPDTTPKLILDIATGLRPTKQTASDFRLQTSDFIQVYRVLASANYTPQPDR